MALGTKDRCAVSRPSYSPLLSVTVAELTDCYIIRFRRVVSAMPSRAVVESIRVPILTKVALHTKRIRQLFEYDWVEAAAGYIFGLIKLITDNIRGLFDFFILCLFGNKKVITL